MPENRVLYREDWLNFAAQSRVQMSNLGQKGVKLERWTPRHLGIRWHAARLAMGS